MWRAITAANGTAWISAAAVLVVGSLIALSHDLGPQARHMGMHIALMNVVAPLLAALFGSWRAAGGALPSLYAKHGEGSGVGGGSTRSVAASPLRHPPTPPRHALRARGEGSAPLAVLRQRASLLWLAALAQIAVLWGAHVPALHHAALANPLLQLATHAVLFAVALAFWTLLLGTARRWHAIAALLLTGKLVCLIAALLVFAPRALYGHAHGAMPALDDQQLAGLLMIAACPLSYLTAAIVITVDLVGGAGARPWRSAG